MSAPRSASVSGARSPRRRSAGPYLERRGSVFYFRKRLPYDADWFRKAIAGKGILPCIPGRKSRDKPVKYDKRRYRKPNRIEIMFGRLKDWRRVATRYDSSPTVFLSAIALAATVIFWLRVLSLATKSIPECPVETGAGTTSQTAEWPKLSTLRMGKGSDITHRSDRYPDDRHSCRVSLQCGTRSCASDCHFHHIFPDFSLLTLTP